MLHLIRSRQWFYARLLRMKQIVVEMLNQRSSQILQLCCTKPWNDIVINTLSRLSRGIWTLRSFDNKQNAGAVHPVPALP